jgi:hypothetical protein
MIIIFVGLRPEYECNMPIVLQQQSIGARPNVRDLGCFKATEVYPLSLAGLGAPQQLSLKLQFNAYI